MRILMLAPQPFFEERGTPIAVRFAAEALAAQGHEVDLLTFHLGRPVEMPGVRHHRIAAPPGVRYVPIGFSLRKLVCDLWMLASAIRLMISRRPDVVHAVEEAVFLALPLAAIGRAQLVYDADSVLSEQIIEKWPAAAPLARMVAHAERFAFRRSDLVIAVCPAVQDVARRAAAWGRVYLLPDIAMGGASSVGPGENLRDGAGDRLVALYVGNLESYQGVELLLDAVAALPDGQRPLLVVIGGSEEAAARYGAKAERLGVGKDVSFLGPRPLDALGHYLRQADILCSPRLKGRNTPMKIFSYMAAGRAILATDIESHRQVLDDDCAELVAAQGPAIAAGLRRLMQDADRRWRIGRAARDKATSDYSHDAFVARLRQAYATLTPPPAPPAAPPSAPRREARL